MNKPQINEEVLNNIMDTVMDIMGVDPGSRRDMAESAFRTMAMRDNGLTFAIIGVIVNKVDVNSILGNERLSEMPKYAKSIIKMATEYIADSVTTEEKFIEMMRIVYQSNAASGSDNDCQCAYCTERRARAKGSSNFTASGIKYYGA